MSGLIIKQIRRKTYLLLALFLPYFWLLVLTGMGNHRGACSKVYHRRDTGSHCRFRSIFKPVPEILAQNDHSHGGGLGFYLLLYSTTDTAI